MGQKVNPIGFRLGVNKEWNSTWYAKKQDFAPNLLEDQKVKKHIKSKYYACGIQKSPLKEPKTNLLSTFSLLTWHDYRFQRHRH